MGVLEKIFGKGDGAGTASAAATAEADPQCRHADLAQHWDSPADMGKAELATYVCTPCGRQFSSEDAAAIIEPPPPVLRDIAEAPDAVGAEEADKDRAPD